MATTSAVTEFHVSAVALALALGAPNRGYSLRGVAVALWTSSTHLPHTTRTAADAVAVAAYTLATGGDRQPLVLQARRLAWAVPQLEPPLAAPARDTLERLRAVLAAQGAAS